MALSTFDSFVDREFDIFVTATKNIVSKAKSELHGLPFLQVVHDMWTSSKNDNILGSCLCFLNAEYQRQLIPVVLTVNNTTHGAEFNADLLKKVYLEHYCIDIDTCTRFITSDTTSAARAVCKFIDGGQQVDCEMHVLNLVLSYSLGLRDNVKTQEIKETQGVTHKAKVAVTGGGAFPDGIRVIQSLREISKYFGSAKRIERLRSIQVVNHAPEGSPSLDGKTRVASCHKLMLTSVLHYWTLQRYYDSVMNTTDDFKVLWEKLTVSDWKLVLEMESIAKELAKYALGQCQSDSCLPSEIVVYRKIAIAAVQKTQFQLLQLCRHDRGTTLAQLESCRKQILKTEQFSEGVQVCWRRMKYQAKTRFTEMEAHSTYLALFIDPRTVPFVDQLIPETLRLATRKLFKDKLAEICIAMNPVSVDQKQETAFEQSEGYEDEFDFVLAGYSVSNVDGNNNLSASAIYEVWMSHCHRINWAEYTYEHSSLDGFEPKKLLSRLKICDPFLWFRKAGDALFPQVALLIRLEFAKVDSSAAQERIFSAAGAAMTEKQTSMSPLLHEKRTLLHCNRDFMQKTVPF